MNLNSHGNAETAEDDVCAPLNVDERWGHEVAEREVEGPIGGGGQSDSLATHTKWVQFWRIDPGDWTPGWREGGNKQVRAGNDGLGCWTLYECGCFEHAVDTIWLVRTVRAE